MSNTHEYATGTTTAQLGVLMPSVVLSAVSLSCKSTPEQINSVRTIDVLGMQNFFDHAGNLVNGSLGAMAVIAVGSAVENAITTENKRPVLLATAAAAAASAVNVAYEAGVYIPPYPKKSAEAGFDGHDAVYGSVAGVLYSAVFCYAALRQRRRIAKRNRHES